MGSEQAIKSGEKIFVALLVIGLIGLLFLIIFGNLSGNLGFTDTTTSFVNESGAFLNTTDYRIVGFTTAGYVGFAVTIMSNTTGGGETIPPANFTINSAAGTFATTDFTIQNISTVNLTYVVTHNSQGELDTVSVIGNLTTGSVAFFSFSNVWFILVAVTILIGIVIGVISLVRRTSGGSRSSSAARLSS